MVASPSGSGARDATAGDMSARPLEVAGVLDAAAADGVDGGALVDEAIIEKRLAGENGRWNLPAAGSFKGQGSCVRTLPQCDGG